MTLFEKQYNIEKELPPLYPLSSSVAIVFHLEDISQ
jgi:hypothetical protein